MGPAIHEIQPDQALTDEPTTLGFFFRLAEMWGLSTDQQITLLGSPARSTYFRWRKDGGDLSVDTLARISQLGSVYKALRIVLDTPAAVDRWIRQPNRYFGGETALDVMLRGGMDDIIKVRQYVDAQRGG